MTLHPRTAHVEAIYKRLAPVYDIVYGATLQDGRRHAMARLAPAAGEWILEIGVGTGLGVRHYPTSCRVAAIDLSSAMLARAKARLASRASEHVKLCRMDAAHLAFPDGCFDAVYAAYAVNVVPDTAALAREIRRVCRRGGRVVLLNHFERDDRKSRLVDRVLGLVAARAGGAKWQLNLETFLRESGLGIVSVHDVNMPPVSSVVVCRRE